MSKPRVRAHCLFASLSLVLLACAGQAPSEGAHVHGSGQLSIAVEEDQSAAIELVAPAESIYGFEHAPGTAEETRAQTEALDRLRAEVASFIQAPAELGCAFETHAVEVVGEGDHADEAEGAGEAGGVDEAEHADEGISGAHSEVHAAYTVRCQAALEGARLRIRMGEAFPDLETLHVTILTPSDQRSERLEGASGEVDL